MKVEEITRRPLIFEEHRTALTTVIDPPGETITIGPETEKPISNDVSVVVSPHGSYRFIYRKDGKIVSGLQVMSRDGKTGVIGNVYTLPEYRRQGLGRDLLNIARKKFKRLNDSQDLTSMGEKFFKGTKE